MPPCHIFVLFVLLPIDYIHWNYFWPIHHIFRHYNIRPSYCLLFLHSRLWPSISFYTAHLSKYNSRTSIILSCWQPSIKGSSLKLIEHYFSNLIWFSFKPLSSLNLISFIPIPFAILYNCYFFIEWYSLWKYCNSI